MAWTESDSKDFIALGDFIVPSRNEQSRIMIKLLETVQNLNLVADLSCGAGHWSEAVLNQYPKTKVYGFDQSREMLQQAGKRLNHHQSRFKTINFDLLSDSWDQNLEPTDAFITSLAVHHLDHAEKPRLFHKLYQKLKPGGILVMADIVAPSHPIGYQIAGDQWNEYVSNKAKKYNKPDIYQVFTQQKWNYFLYPQDDPLDQPSALPDQLNWLYEAGFNQVDVYWMFAGHALMAGWK
ncbi:MAG: class I SAM-dependent methyltransferase [Candidatus Cyclobacteriaceae bacterium M3_2C_046]